MKPKLIRPNSYVALRLPSDTLMVVQLLPNTTVSIGKYGTFQANYVIGRPFYLTFEVLDKTDITSTRQTGLRVVPAKELYANMNDEDATTLLEAETATTAKDNDGVEYDVVGEDREVVMRTNRTIIDDPNSQIMTMDEIEEMKAQNSGSGKDLVAKIMESHSALDQKTAFALAKYTLRKTKKYLKRFTIIPLDVSALARWMFVDKEPMKVMELRQEILALIGSWSNVHFTSLHAPPSMSEELPNIGGGRWLVIDDTAGLLVAYMAEKMGILHAAEQDDQKVDKETIPGQEHETVNGAHIQDDLKAANPNKATQQPLRPCKTSTPATSNTITLIHANAQPNLSLLKYFHFDAFNPSPLHPLESHLKILSWLQLLEPEDDTGYTEPEYVSEEVLQGWKSGKRSNYFRKRRRWERIKFVVDETRAGGFDGLIIASVMNPISILQHTVPLLRGAAQVVVYSPTIESLVELADCYSTGRRTAFVRNQPDPATMSTEDYPLNPTLLLAPTLHTARCKNWQVLPGRTHPLMTGRGGSEGYVFTATRVLPAEGRIEARGKFKRRKIGGEGSTKASSSLAETPARTDVEMTESDIR